MCINIIGFLLHLRCGQQLAIPKLKLFLSCQQFFIIEVNTLGLKWGFYQFHKMSLLKSMQ